MLVAISPAGKRDYRLHDHQLSGLAYARDYPITCLSGGVRNGKSCWAIASIIQETQTKLPPPHIPRVGWIVVPSKDPYWHNIKPEWEAMVGFRRDGGYILDRNLTRLEYTLAAPDGIPWTIAVRSTEDPDSMRAASVRFVWMTEAGKMPEEAYDIAQARVVAAGGSMFIESSPFGLNWFCTRVVQKGSVVEDWRPVKRGGKPFVRKNPEGDPRIAVIMGVPIEANTALPAQYVRELRKNASSEVARREYDGEFFSWSGLIWSGFDPGRHLADIDEYTPEKLAQEKEPWEIFSSLDFGWGHPTAHLWLGVSSKGDYVALDEYRESYRTLQEHAKSIKGSPWHKWVTWRYADPSAAQAQAEMQEYGVTCSNAENDVELGLNRVQQLFESGRLKISRRCPKLIAEIGNYHRNEKTGKPVKVGDDLSDTLRYGLFSHSTHADGRKLPYGLLKPDGGYMIEGDSKEMRDEWEAEFGRTVGRPELDEEMNQEIV